MHNLDPRQDIRSLVHLAGSLGSRQVVGAAALEQFLAEYRVSRQTATRVEEHFSV